MQNNNLELEGSYNHVTEVTIQKTIPSELNRFRVQIENNRLLANAEILEAKELSQSVFISRLFIGDNRKSSTTIPAKMNYHILLDQDGLESDVYDRLYRNSSLGGLNCHN